MVSALFFFIFFDKYCNFFYQTNWGNLMCSSAISTNLANLLGEKKKKNPYLWRVNSSLQQLKEEMFQEVSPSSPPSQNPTPPTPNTKNLKTTQKKKEELTVHLQSR
jgi:hypothetical protein